MGNLIEKFQNERHTGRNRCFKCTVFNVVLSLLISSLLFAILSIQLTTVQATIASVVFVVVSFAAIWLKGYFVPYTPQITRNFFPRSVLQWFDKGTDASPLRSFDPSSHIPTLETANILVYSDDLDDYVVSEGIVSEISECYAEDSLGIDEFLTRLDFEDVSVLQNGEKIYLIRDDERIHYWPSEKAMAVDIILVDVLKESVPSWEMVSPSEKLNLLATVRLFLQQCPDGDQTIGQTSKYETCCDEKTVFKTVCEGSEEVLFARGTG